MDLKYLKIVSEGKFFIWIEKLLKDNSKYVPYCLQHLIVLFDDIIPNLLKTVENEFKKSIGNMNENTMDTYENQKNKDSSNFNLNHKNNMKILNSNFNYLSTIFQILTTQTFKMRYMNPAFISITFGLELS